MVVLIESIYHKGQEGANTLVSGFLCDPSQSLNCSSPTSTPYSIVIIILHK
jgi:hypothetical protein